MSAKKKNRGSRQWRLMDLHLHTPASSDYMQPEISHLDILRTARARGLDIIAFTDHNTVAGYRNMMEEIKQLELLEDLGRLQPEEKVHLEEYRSLLEDILVLPGFEFTATFGFHILAIFSPEKPIREIEHLLLSLNIPAKELDRGSSTVGASSDVLTAYRVIDEAGGIAIAAHANSSNGVAMRGFPFGGQTKIAYTQDPHLHALEVTDLEKKGRRTTANFFSGTKPEYPRRMHCIQGSDAHLLVMDPNNPKELGVGDRATEVLIPEVSFEALMGLFNSNDFARTRPRQGKKTTEYDFVRQAREEGPTIVQDFHESMTVRGGRLYAIIADVCALANTNGGTIYVGVSGNPTEAPKGVSNISASLKRLRKEINNRISPPINCPVDTMRTQGKTIIRVLVPRGDDPPYAVDDSKIYIRDEADTGLAVRDEIVQLVLRGHQEDLKTLTPKTTIPEVPVSGEPSKVTPPRTGVEIVNVEERDGVKYYTMHDLRNGNMVKNVTQSSARRLWAYAISQYRKLPEDLAKAPAEWKGDLGILNKRGGKRKRYDLVQKADGKVRVYFGVTEDGIHSAWKDLVGSEAD